RRIDHHAFRDVAGAVGVIDDEVLLLAAHLISEQRVAPRDGAADRLGIGIDEQARWIEALSVFGTIRAVHAIAVELSGPDVGEIAMPDLVVALAQCDARALDGIVGTAEEAQLDPRRVFRKDGEVDTFAIPGRAEWVRLAGPDAHVRGLPSIG